MSIKTFEHVNIEIKQDESGTNPRNDYDHLSAFYCLKNNRKYTGGNDDFEYSWLSDLKEKIKEFKKEGVFIQEFGYHCYAVIERKQILNEWQVKRISPKLKKTIQSNLDAEIEEFENWLNGEVYGYIITDNEDNHLDSCWGYYGYNYCVKEAEESAKHCNNEIEQGLKFVEDRLNQVCN